jgi:hypothetical protein
MIQAINEIEPKKNDHTSPNHTVANEQKVKMSKKCIVILGQSMSSAIVAHPVYEKRESLANHPVRTTRQAKTRQEKHTKR